MNYFADTTGGGPSWMDVTLLVGGWVLTTLFWAVFSYIVLSLFEYVAHRFPMHRASWLTRKFKFFRQHLEEHRDYHHGECFSGRNFTQGAEGRCLVINIDINPFIGLLAASVVWIPLLFVSLHGAIVFVIIGLVHNLSWGFIHKQMHTPPEKRSRWFKNSALLLWLARYHCVHHIYPGANFSVMFVLPDFIFGTYRAPSAKDVATMIALGLYPAKQPKKDFTTVPVPRSSF